MGSGKKIELAYQLHKALLVLSRGLIAANAIPDHEAAHDIGEIITCIKKRIKMLSKGEE